MSLLQAEALSKEFGGVLAVQALQFEIPAQGVYSIIGPNGAGKTTLLNLLTGLYRPSAGHSPAAGIVDDSLQRSRPCGSADGGNCKQEQKQHAIPTDSHIVFPWG